MMCDFFCGLRGREKNVPIEENRPLKRKKKRRPPDTNHDKNRSYYSHRDLQNISGVLTAAAGVTLIATSGGLAAPIVAGSLTTTAGVIQITDANLPNTIGS